MIKVSAAVKQSGGKFAYNISGWDSDGYFSGKLKRYKDFFQLYEHLQVRFEGLYIPHLPPKKAIGNTDTKFLEERRTYLEEFLLNMSKHDYLW